MPIEPAKIQDTTDVIRAFSTVNWLLLAQPHCSVKSEGLEHLQALAWSLSIGIC